MAKDRFNRFKPINWNSSFKQTGSFIKPEVKKSPKIRDKNQQEFVDAISLCWNSKMNEWELEFVSSIRFSPWMLSDKQMSKLTEINIKYNKLYPEFVDWYFGKTTT
jgi:hypothetical protein